MASFLEAARKTGIQPSGTGTSFVGAASQAGIQPVETAPPVKEKGLLRQIGEGIVRPFAKLGVSGIEAARGVGALGKLGLARLSGGELTEEERQEFITTSGKIQEGFDVPGLGRVKPVPITKPLEVAGVGAELASFLAGGGTIVQASKQFGKQTVLKAVGTSAFQGALEGLIGGAGVALQEEDAGVADVAKGALTGATLGGVLGAAAPVVGKVVRGALGRGAKETTEQVSKKTQSLLDITQPKLTRKVKSDRIREGTVIAGKSSKLGGKKPDRILPTEDDLSRISTLSSRIKNADKLDQFSLARKINTEIGKISTRLRGKFDDVVLDSSKTSEIRSNWETLKKAQQAIPDFNDRPGVSKSAQRNFENRLNLMLKPVKDPKTGQFRQKNIGDLWRIAIDFDNSISDSIKQASVGKGSSPSQLIQKDMWLEDRNIIRDVLKSTAEQLDEESAKAFRELSNLYESWNNIIARADVDVKGKEGILRKELLKAMVKLVGLGVAGGTTIELLK